MMHRHVSAAVLLGLGLSANVGAQALGTAFTYQGQLTESGQPANGLYDLQVCLFDTPANPVALACAADFNDVPVAAGVFTLALDFGAGAFIGQQRLIELRVRPGASTGGYTILSPRQQVRAAPEALRANTASMAPWSGLTGVPAGFADGSDNDSGGTVTSIAAGTGLTGGTITGSGTLGIANNGVGSAQITDGSVAAVDVAPNSLGPGQLADNAVAAAELADNAVDTAALQNLAVTQAKIANGAVGLAQIDTAQVQARLTGTCAYGEYFRGINADGTLACEPVPGVPRITFVDDPANSVGAYSSLAIGNDGLPVISYHDATAGALKVARCANAACTGNATISVVDDPANTVGLHTAIAIGADGLPVISYQDATANTLKVARCANPACTGVATITTVDNPAINAVGAYTDIAIGADGLPVISYQDTTTFALKVAKCVNAACTGTATITTVANPIVNQVGAYTSIAIGADGRPVISYEDATANALMVAKCANAACTGSATISAVEDGANAVGRFTSIAISAEGLPVISYLDDTINALRVAKCLEPDCTGAYFRSTLDDSGNILGWYTSIAIGIDGLPVISYRDNSSQALKVAQCRDNTCLEPPTISTVDDPGLSVGGFTSIAIGRDGLPVISYRDGSTSNSLKVAKCGTRACQ